MKKKIKHHTRYNHAFRNYGKFNKKLIFPLIIILFSSCGYNRYIADDQKLYDGSEVTIKSEEKIPQKNSKERSLENLIRLQPNTKIFFFRLRLWIYNITGETRERGVMHWLKTRLGEPPVYLNDLDIDRTAMLIENRLQNTGFFDASVEYDISQKRQRAEVQFTAHVKKPYQIDNVYFPQGKESLKEVIKESKDESLIKQGDNYSLTNLTLERERIEQFARNKGYYFFNSDHIIFRVDSTIGDRMLDVYYFLKDDIPPKVKQQYTINKITIYSEYFVEDFNKATLDTVEISENIIYFDKNRLFSYDVILSAIFLQPGDIYRRSDHNKTLNHLMGLGVFKFANIRYSETTVNGKPSLNVNIHLTPAEQKSLSLEVKATTKSNNLTGPGLMATYTNRNLFGGAESFSLNLNGSFETTISSHYDPITSTEVGIQSELLLPKFIAPAWLKPEFAYTIPKTHIILSANYLSRTDMMNLFSLKTQFGYQWNSDIATQHRLSPFVFNFFVLGTLSPEFETVLGQQELMRRGLFDQYILGGEYSYFHNTQIREEQPSNNWYLNINFDVAGNFAYLLFNQGLSSLAGERGKSEIGENFSQYFKTDFDTRYFIEGDNPANTTALRLVAGSAIPYGNSDYLPYNKRFTIGGVNSLRAFHPRTLGPGSYKTPDTLQMGYSIYHSGELKLLFTIEQRFDITKYLKGALFLDGGNVWNTQDYKNTPGGILKADEFLRQIALGTGVGLRIDLNFFVIRFDLAFPLAIPHNTEQYFEEIKPLSSSWRKDNLILNFAIGYPF